MKYHIPEPALENHVGFLGGTGSGKTTAAKREIAERKLKEGKKVIIIDPTDVWWGLRLKADGEGKGFPIHIFGGRHQDFPLRAQDAEVLADAFATSSDSAIFVTKDMTVSERTMFFTKFAEVLLRKNRGAVYLIIDESHIFLPQAGAQAGGGAPAMLHAGNNLVSLGRASGFRITLISQRPAKLHKDALSQVQTLVSMRVLSPQDRKAIREWMEDQADAEKGREIIASLPTLKPGQGWVWSPIAELLERVQFDMPTTFDSSKPPEDDGDGPVLKPLDPEGLKKRLATIEAERKANDPKELKAEIAKLTRELATREVEPADTTSLMELMTAVAKNEGIAHHYKQATLTALSDARALHISLGNIVTFLESKAEEPTVTVTDVKITRPPKRAALQVADDITGAMRQPLKVDVKEFMRPEKAVTGDTTLRPAHREILTILAQNSGYGRTMKKLAIFAGKAMSGGFRNYVYFLNGAGLIEKRGEAFFITDAGLKALGSYTPLPTGRDLAEHWKRQLRPAEAEILQHVIDVAPKYISMADLAAACGKAVTGGFRNYVYHLCSLELISGSGSYTISEDLL